MQYIAFTYNHIYYMTVGIPVSNLSIFVYFVLSYFHLSKYLSIFIYLSFYLSIYLSIQLERSFLRCYRSLKSRADLHQSGRKNWASQNTSTTFLARCSPPSVASQESVSRGRTAAVVKGELWAGFRNERQLLVLSCLEHGLTWACANQHVLKGIG